MVAHRAASPRPRTVLIRRSLARGWSIYGAERAQTAAPRRKDSGRGDGLDKPNPLPSTADSCVNNETVVDRLGDRAVAKRAQVGHGAAAVEEHAVGAARGFRGAGDLARSLITYPMLAGPPSVPRSVMASLAQITARGSPLALSELPTI